MRKATWGQTLTLLLGAAAVAVSGENVARSETNADVAGGTSDREGGPSCSGPPGATPILPLPPPATALQQVAQLVKAKDFRSAARLSELLATPQAYWFTGGTPSEVEGAVHRVMVRARNERRVPVLVAYDVPYRDCAQYSFGGAVDTAAYDAWIDGFAKGIGDQNAIVILEPDSLGIIPYNTTLGGSNESCQPTVTDTYGDTVRAPGATPADRYAQLNHAVDSLGSFAASALVYLDGTHSGWLGAGEAAYRLAQAGARQANGFFLNVSNFQRTPQLVQYGTWIGKCLYYANNAAEGGWRLGHYDYCASQYYPATASDPSTWGLTDQWYSNNVDNAANPPSGTSALSHFVLDTGRNGQGPLDASVYAAAPYNQPADVVSAIDNGKWCNPPGSGLGLGPTTATGIPLVDAYLWINDPGVSDGTCDIAGGARGWSFAQYNPWNVAPADQSHFDPLWGQVDPLAGDWFPGLALGLVKNASPPLPVKALTSDSPTARSSDPIPQKQGPLL